MNGTTWLGIIVLVVGAVMYFVASTGQVWYLVLALVGLVVAIWGGMKKEPPVQ